MTRSKAAIVIDAGVLTLLCVAPPTAGSLVATAFTYQGQLKHGGSAVNGAADLQFSLWDAAGSGSPPSGGTQIGATQTVDSMAVSGGLFTITLNAGGEFGPTAFNGEARWLQIAVRSPAGSGDFTTLAPRQPLTAAPFALFALNGPGGSGALWAADGVHIHNTNTGRVGIGTASPTEKLEVVGRVKTGDLITTGPWVDVRACGATGDDDIDDTAAIQAAIDSLGDTGTMRGGTVYFPPGRYLISSTLTIDRRCGLFQGVGPGGSAGTSGSVLKWQGPAGVPMVRITRCWFTRLHGLRFSGNAASRPSAAIDMATAAHHSPVNTQLSLSWIWVGHFSGFEPDGGPGFEDGIVTSGANLQDDQGQMDHIFVQGMAGSCIRLAKSQNVLWRLSNVVLNGEQGATGITCGTRHVILLNPNFGSNGRADIEITNDGMIDVYNMGSEGSGRLAVATSGAQLRVRGGYWQAGTSTASDGKVIDISGGSSVVRVEDFQFTQFGGAPARCKMRGPLAVAIFSNVALPSPPDSFFDLATEHAGERRRIEFLGNSTLADYESFVNDWSHEEADLDRRRNDLAGLTRLRQAAGQVPILEVWNADLTSKLFSVASSGIRLGHDTIFAGVLEGSEIADPGPTAPGRGKLCFRGDGTGKTQLVVRFANGAIQVLATEP